MTEREELKLALEAYLCREMPAGTIIGDPKWWVPKIANAIKKALPQPEQEPVAWWVTGPDGEIDWSDEPIQYKEQRPLEELVDGCGYAPLYTTPPQPKEPEQKPVAKRLDPDDAWNFALHVWNEMDKKSMPGIYMQMVTEAIVKHYTTPPQRKPLTDEMTKQMRESCDSYEMRGAFVDGWLSAEAAHNIKE